MIITKERLMKVSFYGWWAFLLNLLLKFYLVVFFLVCGFSFVYDVLRLFRKRIYTNPDWVSFGCAFVGFVFGGLVYETLLLGGYYFLVPFFLFLILNVFAFLSENK